MTTIGEAWLDVKASPGSEAAFTNQAKGLAIKAGLAFGATIVARKLFSFAEESLEAFKEAEAVTAMLDSRVQALGESAGVTTASVQEMATGLMNLGGVSDETTQSAAALLLTFTNVRNEVGKNNDIFNQAIPVMADMSQVLGTDMKGSALQLGKALNDPVAGITALRRAGVSFTQQQRDQIKALVESGDLLKAQKIVLGELEKEFGGATAAFGLTTAGKTAILSENIGELKETFGALLAEGLNPAIEGLTNWVRELDEAIEKGDGWGFVMEGLLHRVGTAASVFDPEKFEELPNAFKEAAGETVDLNDALRQSASIGDAATRAHDAVASAARDEADAHRALLLSLDEEAQARRDELTEQLKGAGGFIGAVAAIDSARQARQALADAQAKVNKLEAAGKQGTDRYIEAQRALREAAFASLQGQAALEKGIVDYGQSLIDADMSQADAIAKIKEMAREANLTKDQVTPLIDRVKDYARELDVLPDTTRTKVQLDTTQAKTSLAALLSMLHEWNLGILAPFNLPTLPGGGGGGDGSGGGGGKNTDGGGRSATNVHVSLDGRGLTRTIHSYNEEVLISMGRGFF